MSNSKEESPNYSFTIDEICQLFDDQLKSLRPPKKALRRKHIPKSETAFWDLFERYQIANFLYDMIEEKRAKNVAYAFIFDQNLGTEFNAYCLKDD